MSAAEDAFAGTKPVEERHRFDEAALDAWMRANVEGYAGPLQVSQFRGGQSNPTYRLDTPGRAYVLRRKPFGPLLPSAHAVDREFRVISALHGAGFPVARPYALCQDEAVIGAMFYIMSMVEGRVIWNASMPDRTPQERRATFEAEIATLARLHQLDPESIGLGDYGRPGNYFARQVERWSKQYRAAEIDPIPEMDRLIDWLPRTVPPQERTSIVHGDYRLDNMIFDAAEPRVAAVLDWELSTLGDPLADFSYLAMNWNMPADGRSGLKGLDLPALGIPTLEEVAELYCRLTNRAGVPDLNWYFAFGLFRLASITQGIAKRVQVGTAASERARETAARTPHLAAAAWTFAEKAGA
jgi:aminoglycoside phosphotransferase (APT) family kinase protein